MPFIQLPSDSTNLGKKIETLQPDSTLHREVVVLGGAVSTNYAAVNSSNRLNVTAKPHSTGWATAAGFAVDTSNFLKTRSIPDSTSWATNAGLATDSSNFLKTRSIPDSTGWARQAGFSVDSSNFLNVNATVNVSALSSISSIAGIVTVAPSSTSWLSSAGLHFDSSGALQVTLVGDLAGSAVDVDDNTVAGGQSSVALTIAQSYGFDNVGATNWIRVEASSKAPTSNAAGLIVRQAKRNYQSNGSTSAFATSTSFSVASSNAALRSKVFAYSITTTNVTARQVAFYDGATMKWPIVLQAISSAIAGANLAVSPPAYLFANSTGAALTLQTNGSSEAGWVVGISYFQES